MAATTIMPGTALAAVGRRGRSEGSETLNRLPKGMGGVLASASVGIVVDATMGRCRRAAVI
jgi:hypothetical protein